MAQIRHLAILTENVERLVRFYTEAFGMKVVEGIGRSEESVKCKVLSGREKFNSKT